jgi:maleylacetoacetate isomerase/maleylpyruvate isomerase
MAEFILHNYFRSSTSYRVRIALEFKGLPYVYKAVHLLKDGGEQFTPGYRKLNPQAELPTLVHNGKVIAQSAAIIEYLEEVHPAQPLLPKDPFFRAKIRQMCENINSFVHPMGNLKVLQYLEKNHTYDQKMKEEWVNHWTHMGFAATEELLKEHSGIYSFGDSITMVDCFLIPACFTAQRFNVDLAPYPNLRRVNETCANLEPFMKSHPMRQIDTPAELRIS